MPLHRVLVGARWASAAIAICCFAPTVTRAQEITLLLGPAQTATFTLNATLHVVHGTFRLKRGEVHFDRGSAKISGEVVFDATSGNTGNDSRDRKMHKDVLESGLYPEITFRPDKIEGSVAMTGSSPVQVHGLFGIHGKEHEMTIPVQITLDSDKWTVDAHFQVPYAQWGMKKPSLLFIRVDDSVDVDLHCAGTASRTQ